MATPENGTNMSEDLDIDALINAADVDEKDVSAVVSSLHQELNSVTKASGGDLSQDSGLGSTPEEASLSQQPVTSNGFQQTQEKVVLPPSASSSSSSSITTTTSSSVPPSLTPAQPVKTKGEVSTSISTATSSTPSSSRPGLTLNLSKTETSTQPQAQDSTNRRASLSTMSPFGGLTHGPQTSLLTIEEQSAIYKQASLLAIYAMSSKNGPAKAKEMLAVVTKVKNFLTNLVQLAGNSGPQVRTAVHSLVQKLVAGSITEEEFAKKIEQDLKSKHQPDLLPFLQTAVYDELNVHVQVALFLFTCSRYGVTEITEEFLTFLSHATEERLRNLVEQVTVISQHRTELLKGNSRYEPATDVRAQLKVLERIDEVSATRKQEREKEKIIRAAKSRSKQDDPELAKMKEQAKQIQIAEEREIHQKAANVQALAAIGRRKRTATTAFGGESSSASPSAGNASIASVFNSPSTSRTNRPKQRRILSKDIIMSMEQCRETRHSQILYKSLL
ncbi:PREDICTED: transcription initiation factor TFIID subunit 4B-like [Amphimedon queenslandica]|uniref:TAFH domain-containing protein n=1 Tax=Amphimedon queenslandica TaxID=400682 RepID=A0AAN0J918_AMPQE|nr:PREDICTED: transcription initiation factor TFIID subunit 4B-like [Amphimedon queenslandica]|eukprot:XP_019853514.1 PREDICTED: transcription initiation factor TFIID subunit 4B-like [Amphimedon queenslandica]